MTNYQQALNSAKKNKKGLIRLKNALVTLQQYEMASELRSLELKYFPETEETKLAKLEAINLELLFRMVGLNISVEAAYLISKTLEVYNEKRGEFTVDDGVSLQHRNNELFFKEDFVL